jgi:glycosidase
MKQMTVTPSGLTKRLVGQTVQVEIFLNKKYDYDVEAVCKAFGTDVGVPLTPGSKGSYRATIQLRKSGFFDIYVRFKKEGTKTWRFVKQRNQKLAIPLQVDPAWLAHAMVYCVFVRFFAGKQNLVEGLAHGTVEEDTFQETRTVNNDLAVHPGDGGTFDDVKAYLDTLQSMHINTLYFNPIHPIGELYRGYNTVDRLPSFMQPGSPYSIKDYKAIDPELTYDKDTKKHLLSDPHQEFKDLIKAAHDRGMFVIMDLVFNHTAHDFVFARIKPEWYLYKEHITSLDEPYLYPEDAASGKPWGDPRHSMAPFDHGIWWKDCAQLNWEYRLPKGANDPPPNYSLNEMWEYFKSIPQYWIKHFGVDGFRCDVAYKVPSTFWHECIAEARAVAREAKTNRSHDVVFIGESYEDDLDELQKAGFSAVYGDFSRKLYNPLTLKGYLDYIYNQSGNFFPDGSLWFHFPDSHDFDRNPRKITGGQDLGAYSDLLANQSRYLLTVTLPGIPLLFNGFEKVEWQPINIMSYGAIDWERDSDLRDFIRKINFIRKHHPALQRGTYSYIPAVDGLNEKTKVFAFMRTLTEETILVVVNMDVREHSGEVRLQLSDEFEGEYRLLDLLHQKTYERAGRELTVMLEPGEAHIFLVSS